MGIIVNNNLAAANTARNLSGTYGKLGTSIQRMSTGLRVNSASDDAAGLAIREMMRADITATQQGIRNAADAVSLIQTADGSLGVIDEKLTRMKELAEQAATGTYTTVQRDIINSEYQAMAAEIDRIANATNFNGIKLLDGSVSNQHGGQGIKVHFGTGNEASEDYYFIKIGDARATSSTGLRVGGDAKNDIWGQGGSASGELAGPGCCTNGFDSLNGQAGFISGQTFSYGYNWDWTEDTDEKLISGKYLAGRYAVGSSDSLQDLVLKVNAGTQSRVGLRVDGGALNSAVGLGSGTVAVCIGNETYYWGDAEEVEGNEVTRVKSTYKATATYFQNANGKLNTVDTAAASAFSLAQASAEVTVDGQANSALGAEALNAAMDKRFTHTIMNATDPDSLMEGRDPAYDGEKLSPIQAAKGDTFGARRQAAISAALASLSAASAALFEATSAAKGITVPANVNDLVAAANASLSSALNGEWMQVGLTKDDKGNTIEDDPTGATAPAGYATPLVIGTVANKQNAINDWRQEWYKHGKGEANNRENKGLYVSAATQATGSTAIATPVPGSFDNNFKQVRNEAYEAGRTELAKGFIDKVQAALTKEGGITAADAASLETDFNKLLTQATEETTVLITQSTVNKARIKEYLNAVAEDAKNGTDTAVQAPASRDAAPPNSETKEEAFKLVKYDDTTTVGFKAPFLYNSDWGRTLVNAAKAYGTAQKAAENQPALSAVTTAQKAVKDAKTGSGTYQALSDADKSAVDAWLSAMAYDNVNGLTGDKATATAKDVKFTTAVTADPTATPPVLAVATTQKISDIFGSEGAAAADKLLDKAENLGIAQARLKQFTAIGEAVSATRVAKGDKGAGDIATELSKATASAITAWEKDQTSAGVAVKAGMDADGTTQLYRKADGTTTASSADAMKGAGTRAIKQTKEDYVNAQVKDLIDQYTTMETGVYVDNKKNATSATVLYDQAKKAGWHQATVNIGADLSAFVQNQINPGGHPMTVDELTDDINATVTQGVRNQTDGGQVYTAKAYEATDIRPDHEVRPAGLTADDVDTRSYVEREQGIVDSGNQKVRVAANGEGSKKYTASALAEAINTNKNSDYWAMTQTVKNKLGQDESMVYVFSKEGGDNNSILACEQAGRANGSASTAAAGAIDFQNMETGEFHEAGTKMSLGGEHWATMTPQQTKSNKGHEVWNVTLNGRDVGKERDLWITDKGELELPGLDESNIQGMTRDGFHEIQNAANAEWAGAEVRTQSSAQEALAALDEAIVNKDKIRADLGALQNRLENTMTNLEIQSENLQASESRISDVDTAKEMTEFTKNNVLTQAGVSMLSQANSLSQLALSLMR